MAILKTKVNTAERDSRYKRVREAMAREGLEAVLVYGDGAYSGPIRYLTEFQTGWHHLLFLLPTTGDPVAGISSPALPPRVAARGWVSEVFGGFNVYDTTFASKMTRAMRGRGITKGRVGVVGLEWAMPHGLYERFRQDLPGVQLVNADEMMDRIRTVKSPLEVQMIRETHEVLQLAYRRLMELLEPGKAPAEVVDEVSRAARAEGAATVSVQISEGKSLGPPPKLKCDDILRSMVSLTGECGYRNEHLLTCLFRKPSEVESKLKETELRAFEEVCRQAKTGLRFSDLAKTYDGVFEEDGWEWDPPREGYDYHGIGLDSVERPCYSDVMRLDLRHWGAVQDWKLEGPICVNYHPRRFLKPPAGVKASAYDKEVLSWFPLEVMLGVNEDILVTGQGAEKLLGDVEIAWVNMKK